MINTNLNPWRQAVMELPEGGTLGHIKKLLTQRATELSQSKFVESRKVVSKPGAIITVTELKLTPKGKDAITTDSKWIYENYKGEKDD